MLTTPALVWPLFSECAPYTRSKEVCVILKFRIHRKFSCSFDKLRKYYKSNPQSTCTRCALFFLTVHYIRKSRYFIGIHYEHVANKHLRARQLRISSFSANLLARASHLTAPRIHIVSKAIILAKNKPMPQ